MTGRDRSGAGLLAAVALVAAVLGGAAALLIGKAAGWTEGGETVVIRSSVSDGEGVPAAIAPTRPPARGAFDPGAIYRGRSDGVVTIYSDFPGQVAGDSGHAQGSGFVVSPDGYILTNSHVITTAGEDTGGPVRAAEQLFVEFRGGDRVDARIVGWDVFSDVGVVKVDPADHRLTPVPLGDSSAVSVGEPVAAIGSPFGQAGSLTVGVVSATERFVGSITSIYEVVDAIQTDAPINRGNSGGPLFDARGDVIGINAQIRSDSGNAEGVGFAIPINSARRSLEQLIATGKVRYAWLGVSTQTLTPSVAGELGLDASAGAIIQEVVPGSPAEKAGLRGGGEVRQIEGVPVREGGDVVVAIDGKPVRTTEDLVRDVSGRHRPGDRARFAVLRDGKRIVVTVTLGERPENPDLGP